MITAKNYIGNKPTSEGSKKLISFNPANGKSFTEDFRAATEGEVDAAIGAAMHAFEAYKAKTSNERATFLRAIAQNIEDLGDEMVQRASAETALPEARIKGERGRTCNQLRSFADIIEEGSWVNARIDTALADRAPVPKPDLRKMEVPMGPVAVFGASNFPLAYSTAGGDTASALASGCPVIVKGHESHLGTNDLVTQAVLKAVEETGMPKGVFSMVNGGIDIGQQLAKDERIKAIGFTGSLRGGRALFDTASQRKTPIPVYAEMGSTNPVVFFPDKLKTETEDLAKQLAGSVTLGVGQFCTSPGLLIGLASEELTQFTAILETELSNAAQSTMLNEGIGASYLESVSKVTAAQGVEALAKADTAGKPGCAKVKGSAFIKNPELHHEVFGPFTIVIECEGNEELLQVIQSLEGQLTGSFMATEKDIDQFSKTIDALTDRVGRIICNGVPTGVEVCPAMHHGGPYPASTSGKYTSVGRDAIIRFTRSVAFQSWPDKRLPRELQDANPSQIWRLVNNDWTQNPV